LKKEKPKAKYDWNIIKVDFFKSNHLEVKGFFEEQCGTYNGRIRSKTTGWAKEKEKWKEKMTKDALEQLQSNRTKSLATCLDHLLIEVKRRVDKPELIGTMKVNDLHTLWQLLRCENGLSDRITEQKNDPKEVDWKEVRDSLSRKLDENNKK